jgi:hypothetical protein
LIDLDWVSNVWFEQVKAWPCKTILFFSGLIDFRSDSIVEQRQQIRWQKMNDRHLEFLLRKTVLIQSATLIKFEAKKCLTEKVNERTFDLREISFYSFDAQPNIGLSWERKKDDYSLTDSLLHLFSLVFANILVCLSFCTISLSFNLCLQ